MPWNDQNSNGSPWGQGGQGGRGGGQNPWGQGGRRGGRGSGGGQPPHLEDMIRRLQDRFRALFGGGKGKDGKGGGSGPIWLVLIAVILVWLCWPGSAWYQVDANQNALVLRFGEYNRTTQPGLHFKLPYPLERAEIIDVTGIRQTFVGETPDERLMLTQDENLVDLDFTVQWRVDHGNNISEAGVRDFAFNVRDPQSTVRMVAESAMREVAGQQELQLLIGENRVAVSDATRDIIQETLNEYSAGIEVLEVQLGDGNVPDAVLDSFEDVAAARQERDRLIAAANQYDNQVTERVQGQSSRILEDAEAYRIRVTDEARGQSDRFRSIYAEYARAPDITRRRIYLETMERVLSRSDLLILDQTGGSGIVPYLPLDQLNQNRRRPENSGGQ